MLRDIEAFADTSGRDVDSHSADILASALLTLCRLLAPIAPHITHEIWEQRAQQGQLADGGWPAASQWRVSNASRTTVVQINGIKQFEMLIPGELGELAARMLLNEHLAQRSVDVGAPDEALFIRRPRFDIFNLVMKR